MTPGYSRLLDAALGASIRGEFATDRRGVMNYSVVLVVDEGAGPQTVRVYDRAHGVNETHRYSRGGGKQPAEILDAGTFGEGMVRRCARSRPRTKR